MTQGLVRSLISLLVLAPLGGAYCAIPHAFTVVDEIGLAHFGDPYTGKAEAVQFSPDDHYFAVNTERGRLDVNRPEGSLRIYRSEDALNFLKAAQGGESPPPVWVVDRATDIEGPIIGNWRWLADSSGIAFLERGPQGADRLVLADLKTKTVEPLSPAGQAVKAFDVRDARHYVYVVASDALVERAQAEGKAAAVVGTGRPLTELLFPVDLYPNMASWADRGELWAMIEGKRIQFKDPSSGQPVVLFDEGQRALALSPDGRSLITALALSELPAGWESQYPPPFAASPYRIRAGRQDLTAFMGATFLSQYVLIDLQTSRVQRLINAPTSGQGGWWGGGSPQWSKDGRALLLPATFYDQRSGYPVSRPCAALYLEPASGHRSCVEPLKAHLQRGYETGYHSVNDIRFEGGDATRPVVSFSNLDGSQGATEYRKLAEGEWTAGKRISGERPAGSHPQLEITVKQDLNDPPVLVAINKHSHASRALWDPNPQLKDIALGKASVYSWKDAKGRDWKGGLFKPADFKSGQRYPLVIQTHGFAEHQFRPSGIFPTAMAARALAAVGMLVLQLGEATCPVTTSEEGPCAAAGYQSALERLQADGLVDPERVGLIGFSRTCFYVMQTLTAGPLHVKAASITDGVMEDYLQYLTALDMAGNAIANEADAMIGERPFGEGLQTWLQRSPLFNMDKVTAPVLVVSEGRPSLLFMWAPYAALRYLSKPTELILLNTDEHVLTNPAMRLASQGGSVDWFRFWLQGYEDPDPAKSEQYQRWEKLCDMQVTQNPSQPSFCVRSKTH